MKTARNQVKIYATATEESTRSIKPPETFYRRPLPSSLHSFTSDKGRQLFKESLINGTAENYYSLAGNFTMQSEPAFCGLGSLVMVLNALSVDPGKKWKGIWRWYHDEIIECTPPMDRIKANGLTFPELTAIARCNGLHVISKRITNVTNDEFLHDVENVCKSNDKHMIVSFSRKSLNQTGDGHFSPIGAYHAGEKSILIMDTARFKYPSYFCNSNDLYNAMIPKDTSTNLSRGYMILSKGAERPISLTKIQYSDIKQLRNLLGITFPSIKGDLYYCIGAILEHLNQSNISLKFSTPGVDLVGRDLVDKHSGEISGLILETISHPYFKHISCVIGNDKKLSTIYGKSKTDISLATIMLLSLPKWIDKKNFNEFNQIQTPILREEINRLSEQFEILLNDNCKCNKF